MPDDNQEPEDDFAFFRGLLAAIGLTAVATIFALAIALLSHPY